MARSSLFFVGIGFGPALPVYPVKVTLSPRRDEGKVKSGEEVEGGAHKKTNLGRNKKRLEGKGKRLVRLGRFNNGGRTMRLN